MRQRMIRALAALVAGASLCAGAAPAGALTIKLNAPLAAAGDVTGFAVSPDGSRVVYLADDQQDGFGNLFSVPAGGGTPVRLNAQPPGNGDVVDFKIAPDGQRVIYRAIITPNQTELYAVAIGGGTPARLSQALVAGGNVLAYEIAPDSASVAYLADATVDNDAELFINAFAGPSARLNVALPAGGDINAFAYSDNGDYLIYRGDQEVNDRIDAYSVEPDGTNRRRLSGNLPATGDVSDFGFAPNSQRAIFIADAEDGKDELYVAPLEGPGVNPTKLSGTLGADRDVTEFAFTPDGQDALFRADGLADEKYELFRVPLAGGTPIRASTGTGNADSDVSPGGYAMAPAGNRLLFLADGVIEGQVELFSVPGDGSTGVFRINSAQIQAAGNVTSFAINATGERVVYRADEQTDEKYELYGNAIPGGTRIKLSPDTIDDVFDYQLSADGAAVFFRASTTATGAINLYRAPVAGGQAVRLDAGSVAGGNVAAFKLAPGGRRTVYLADHDEDEKIELYAFDSFLRTYAPLATRGQ